MWKKRGERHKSKKVLEFQRGRRGRGRADGFPISAVREFHCSRQIKVESIGIVGEFPSLQKCGGCSQLWVFFYPDNASIEVEGMIFNAHRHGNELIHKQWKKIVMEER